MKTVFVLSMLLGNLAFADCKSDIIAYVTSQLGRSPSAPAISLGCVSGPDGVGVSCLLPRSADLVISIVDLNACLTDSFYLPSNTVEGQAWQNANVSNSTKSPPLQCKIANDSDDVTCAFDRAGLISGWLPPQ